MQKTNRVTRKRARANTAFNVLSSIGNKTVVATGYAKGSKGVVMGKHDVIEHILVYFQPETLEKLMLGDKFLVKAFGLGLKFIDFADVKVMNMDQRFFEALDAKPNGEKLEVPVTHIIPAAIMGSRLGANQKHSGDIQLFVENGIEQYGLDDLRD